jgi:photosystem II stability/assembly factor-like uncharacterized protein
VQSRILIMIGLEGAAGGQIPASLYASDDGGQTWKLISLSVNGQAMQMGELMWVVGSTVYVGASSSMCNGGCVGRLHLLTRREQI